MEKALKLENRNLHMGAFCFAFNKDRNEFISGADDLLMKFLPLNSSTARESIDENCTITAIALGKEAIYYSQYNTLQMATYNSEGTYNPQEATVLTTFNTAVSFILYNRKHDYVVACAEDNNILHCIELSTKKVYQHQTQSEVSIKNMTITSDYDLLLSVGCDGMVTVYQFKEGEGLILVKTISHVFTKTTLENKEVMHSLDVNKNNLCVLSGDIMVRYFTLNSTKEKNTVNTNTAISHADTITLVKWVSDSLLLTMDSSKRIKIWDEGNRTLLYNFEPLTGDVNNLTVIVNDESFNIAYGDNEGSINISEGIMFPKTKSQIIKQKSRSVSGVDSHDFDNIVDNMIEIIDSKQKLNEEDLHKINEEELLDISMMEDEDGNIRNKDEINKLKEEKEQEAQDPNLNEFNFIREKLQICDIQDPFISSRTRGNEENNVDNTHYLCCNLTGKIISKREGTLKAVNIIYADTTNKRNLNFVDTNEYELAAMNNIGIFFANKIEEINMDEYEADTRRSQATIEFKPIQLPQSNSLINDWNTKLPKEENPILLALGNDWCCVYTSLSFLRFYSIFGSEKCIVSTHNSIISMAGFENYLAIVYHVSVPFSQSQQLRYKILDSERMFGEVYDGILPISPDSTLIWFGYSEEGILLTYDSYNILRGLFYDLCNSWIPMIDLGDKYAGTNINFWVFGVEEGEVFGIEMKGDMIEPPALAHPKQMTHKFNIPLIDNASPSIGFLVQYYMIQFYEKRYEKYEAIKELRSFKQPEYCLTENLKDENDIKLMKRDNDKLILSTINEEMIKGNNSKVIVLFDYLLLKKSKDLAISICSEYKLTTLANYLTYKLRLYQLSLEKKTQQLPMQRMMDTTNNKLIGKDNNNNYKEEPAQLSSFAINIETYQNMEESIRNELKEKGLYKEGEVGEKEEDDTKTKEVKKTVISLFNNKEPNKKQHDLFSDLSKIMENKSNDHTSLLTSPQKAVNNTNANKAQANNNNSKLGFKRKYPDSKNSTLPYEKEPTLKYPKKA